MEMTARKFNLESRLRKRGRPSNLTYFEEKAPDPFLLAIVSKQSSAMTVLFSSGEAISPKASSQFLERQERTAGRSLLIIRCNCDSPILLVRGRRSGAVRPLQSRCRSYANCGKITHKTSRWVLGFAVQRPPSAQINCLCGKCRSDAGQGGTPPAITSQRRKRRFAYPLSTRLL